MFGVSAAVPRVSTVALIRLFHVYGLARYAHRLYMASSKQNVLTFKSK